jgi:hypothetical protein
VSWTFDHPVAHALRAAADGRFPPPDGVAEIVAPDDAGTQAVVSFTGHSFVMTTLPAERLCELPVDVDGYGGANHPSVLMLMAGDHSEIGSLDVVLLRRAGGIAETQSALAVRDDLEHHPRVQRARHHRRNVRVLGDERGFVTIGQGLLGRTEVSIELTASGHGRGAGRRLLAAAVDDLPAGELVFGQVAPGNAASLRVFLACGFVPIGSEVLITQRASSSGFQKPGSGVARPEA